MDSILSISVLHVSAEGSYPNDECSVGKAIGAPDKMDDILER